MNADEQSLVYYIRLVTTISITTPLCVFVVQICSETWNHQLNQFRASTSNVTITRNNLDYYSFLCSNHRELWIGIHTLMVKWSKVRSSYLLVTFHANNQIVEIIWRWALSHLAYSIHTIEATTTFYALLINNRGIVSNYFSVNNHSQPKSKHRE